MGKFEPQAGVLTEKQERIFWLALKGGFFDYPRKIDTVELGSKAWHKPLNIIRNNSKRYAPTAGKLLQK